MKTYHLRIIPVVIITALLLLAAVSTAQAKALADSGLPAAPRTFLPLVGDTVRLEDIPSTQPSPQIKGNQVPTLEEFIHSVMNGQSSVVRGVYVQDLFAFAVIQQPLNQSNYVSPETNMVTQFYAAAQFGVTGLLAHNDKAGKNFFDMASGQAISIVYGDGTVQRYQINQIDQFQALEPANPQSDFIDLSTGSKYTSADVFSRFYMGDNHVTFQTCIAREGSSSWGRLFVSAELIP